MTVVGRSSLVVCKSRIFKRGGAENCRWGRREKLQPTRAAMDTKKKCRGSLALDGRGSRPHVRIVPKERRRHLGCAHCGTC